MASRVIGCLHTIEFGARALGILCGEFFHKRARIAEFAANSLPQLGKRRQASAKVQTSVCDALPPGEVGANVLSYLLTEGVGIRRRLRMRLVDGQVVGLEGAGAKEIPNGVDRTGDHHVLHAGIDVLQVRMQRTLLVEITKAKVIVSIRLWFAHIDSNNTMPRCQQICAGGDADSTCATGNEQIEFWQIEFWPPQRFSSAHR